MNAPIMPEQVPAAFLNQVEEYWAGMVALSDRRLTAFIRENHELRERLSRLAPLLPDWAEYDRWAAAAREYHEQRRRRAGR
jgi:hypothetical protein